MSLNDKTTDFCTAVLVVWMLLADPARAAVEVPDDAGHLIRLAHPAQRIVSLAPHITELLFAAGAGSALVGVSEYSDYPAAARQLPRVGGGNGLDLEAILALQPDLVIAWGSGNPPGQVARLRRLGLPVFVSEPGVMGDIVSSLERFGQLTGHATTAAAAVRRFEARRAGLARRYSARTPVRVFFQIWDRPLMTVNGDHLISDASRLCSGSNVFADLPGLAPQVGIESVLERNPQAIVAVGAQTEAAAVQAYWQRWPELAAVRGQHVYTIPRELLVRHSPRILQGAEQLCRLLERVRAATVNSRPGLSEPAGPQDGRRVSVFPSRVRSVEKRSMDTAASCCEPPPLCPGYPRESLRLCANPGRARVARKCPACRPAGSDNVPSRTAGPTDG